MRPRMLKKTLKTGLDNIERYNIMIFSDFSDEQLIGMDVLITPHRGNSMTIITKEEAKSTSLEIWWYLKEYPEINQMNSLPESIFRKIKTFWRTCALCDYMIDNDLTCSDFCPLQHCVEGSM